MEIMIVVIIMGVMVSLAIPQYAKTVDRARLQDGVNQLTAIHAAMLIYRAQNGAILTGSSGSSDHAYLNTNLYINIIPNGLVYAYSGNASTGIYTVTAVREGKTLTLTQDPVSYPTNPACTPSGGACP